MTSFTVAVAVLLLVFHSVFVSTQTTANSSTGTTVNQIFCSGQQNNTQDPTPVTSENLVASDGQCPYPYTSVGTDCLMLSKVTRTWNNSRRYCQGINGDLATTRKVYYMQNFLIDEGAQGEVWIGGKKINQTFQWIDTETDINTTSFVATLPHLRGDNNCVYVNKANNPPLANFACSKLSLFMCQFTS
nr:C-type lectin domain family 2 member B-like [Cherax quadricarinatus]